MTALRRTKRYRPLRLRLVVGTAVLAACSAPASQPSSEISPGGGQTSASATLAARPSSSPSSRPATETGADELAAKFPRTAAGAEAFVGYLFGILRQANVTPDPSLVAPLVDQRSCSDCKHWVDSLAAMRTAGEHFVGDFVVAQSVSTRQITGLTAIVVATVVTPAGQRVDSHGTVVHTRASTGPLRYDLRLEFRKHWVVTYAESVL